MRALLEEHAPRVWRFALRLTGDVHQAEDLSQEALLRAWRRRWRLRDPRRARVWLFSITVNLWRDEVRRQSRRPARTALLAEDQPGTNVAPAQQLIDRDDVKRALDAMDELPSRQREVLYLHACESLSLAEIAGVLGTSRISAEREEAVKGPDDDAGTTGRAQLVKLETEIVTPLDHYVVLGVTPAHEKTLAFAVQVRILD